MTRSHAELPLDDAAAVTSFFAAERPEYVVLAAAKVGGIVANSTQGADFIRENLQIQMNVIDAAYRHGATQTAVPRLELHLSEARRAADRRGRAADRPDGAD